MYLRGKFFHKLDAKGRLSLPSRFRKAFYANALCVNPLSANTLPDEQPPINLVVTLSPTEDYLMVFDEDGFEAWVNSLFEKDGEGYQANDLEQADQRKELNSRALDVELDASGRIGIPIDQREAVSLKKDVVLIGDADHFEIWDAKRWDEHSNKVSLDSLFEKKS